MICDDFDFIKRKIEENHKINIHPRLNVNTVYIHKNVTNKRDHNSCSHYMNTYKNEIQKLTNNNIVIIDNYFSFKT